ncbi:MAG: polysaccharide biosynthesis tyrosine autokinase [Verrucomicrobiota bacterium]|nr:polysaccharide biosynthesis tyrosine autokinase [Verrucomicrobiota bacterium]
MEPLKHEPTPEARLHFLDYWRIIRIRKTIIIAVFLLVAITATVVTFVLPPSYASTTRIKIEPTVSDVPGLGNNQPYLLPYDPYWIQTEFQVIQDQVVLKPVIEKLHLNEAWGKKYAGGEVLKTPETMRLLKKRMSLDTVRNTSLIEITIYDEDPQEAAQIANAIAEEYKKYRLNNSIQQAQGGIKVMDSTFAQEDTAIQTLRAKKDELRKKLGINDTDPNSLAPSPTITPREVEQYTQELIDGNANYMKLKGELTRLQTLKPDELRQVLPTTVPDTTLTALLGDLNDAEQKLATLKTDYSPQHPEVVRAQALVDKINKEIDDRVNGIMAGLEVNVQSQAAALASISNTLQQTKEKDQEEAIKSAPYWEAKQDLANLQQIHNLLYAKIDEEKLDTALPKTGIVEIIRQAEPGKEPVRPNKTLNIALGIVVGLIVGVGLAFFIEYLDTSVKTIDDVERALQAPVLGVIPQNVGYLIDEDVEGAHAEAYRVLRTHVMFSRKNDKLNAVAVVSAGAGEGKSTTTFNLATVFAQAGDRVLVVDSDLRRPTLHKILKVSNNVGLVSYLLKQNTLEESIQRTKIPSLDFMASGKLPSSSMSILNSPQMKELIGELKQRYDFVFFDSPPILGVSDASILASEVDMTIQVIQYRRYPQPMNIRAKQLIEKVGGNLLGIVLNNINISQDESYYYYSGYYYDYYYKSRDDEKPSAYGKPRAYGKASGDKTASDGAAPAEIKQKY